MNASNVTPPLFGQTYLNLGKGDVVILLNGLFGNLGIWRPLADHLEKDFNVIVPRLPLFDLPSQHTNLKYLVSVLHEFIEWNQLTNVSIVGHAVGGQLAILYARHHPDNVNRLVLSGSSGLFEYDQLEEANDSQEINYEFVSKKVKSAFYNQSDEVTRLTQEIYLNVHNIPKRLAISSFVRSSLHSSVSSFLGQLTIPIQLIWGLQDKVSSPQVALHFHDLLPNAQLRFIDKCGHLPMIEQAQQFNETVWKFLKGIE